MRSTRRDDIPKAVAEKSRPVRLIGPEKINPRDSFFRHSYQRPIGPLVDSIREIGIANPVILRGSAGNMQVVHGFSRLAAAKRLRLKKVPALVFSRKELPDAQAFDLAFFDNASTRSFNLIEQAMAAHIMSEKIKADKKTIIFSRLPAMGLSPSAKILDGLLSLNKLEPGWKKIIAEQGIAMKNAMTLIEFSRDERGALMRLLRELRPGTNSLGEMLRLVKDISARDGVPVRDLVSDREIEEIMSSGRLSAPQRLEAVMEALRRKRYPKLDELNTKFSRARAKLGLPASARLRPSPNFEDAECFLSLRFSSPRDLRELAEKLKRAADDPALKEILET